MCRLTICFMTICLLVHVKASPDISLENLLERLVTLEDWKRETEKEVRTLRETVSQQGTIIKNLEHDLEIQTNLTATLRQTYKENVKHTLKDTHEVQQKTEPEYGSNPTNDGHVSDNRIRAADLENTVQVGSLTKSKRQIAGGIAFTAYLDHDVDPGSKQTIVFNQIVTNDGNAYNLHTGIFTCPEAGVYLFSFFIGERSDTDHISQFYAELRVNSHLIVGAAAETVHSTQDSQGGNTAVVRLQPGDAVWVDAMFATHHVEGNGRRFTTFTGVYLYA